jgi:hypothetical protein
MDKIILVNDGPLSDLLDARGVGEVATFVVIIKLCANRAFSSICHFILLLLFSRTIYSSRCMIELRCPAETETSLFRTQVLSRNTYISIRKIKHFR